MSNDAFAALAATDPVAAARVLERMKARVMTPHAGQIPVLASNARFRVVRAGRRFGKTKLSAREIIMNALTRPDTMNWWVANTYNNVKRGYREVLRQLPPGVLAKPAPPSTANQLSLWFKNGAVIEFYSGGNPDALAGEGVDFVVVDEAGLIADHVWTQLIRPTLMDSGGRALIISTPRGRNWFWRVWNYGQDSNRPQYASWHFSSYDNPHIPDEEIDEARDSMPEILFRQEMLAEFLAGESAIFNLEKALVVPGLAEPRGELFMGVDLAKAQDFTVLHVDGPGGIPVWHERFNSRSWPDQRARIRAAIEDLEGMPGVEQVSVFMDTNGVGDVVYDELDAEGVDVVPLKWQNRDKNNAVKLLGADLERGRTAILEEQREEFEAFEYAITPSGNMTYQAPEGGHDDEVYAKMLAHWGRVHEGPGEVHVVNTKPDEAEVDDREALVNAREDVVPDSADDIMNRAEVWN